MDTQYAAGFFDGEGCFLITSNFQVKVIGSQKKPEVLYRFMARYGGHVYERGRISQWQLNKRDEVKAFIEDVKPYLIVKLPDAELMLKMISLNSKNSERPQAKNGRYLPNPNHEERKKLYAAYKALRKK